MTAHRDLKRIIRERQKKTHESYTAARAHVFRDRAALLGLDSDRPATMGPVPVDAVVLKLNKQSLRVRILGEEDQVTFRSGDVCDVVPGHLVTLVIERRWMWRGDAYASGRIENARIDIAKLGLEPLPLEGGELEDVAAYSEPYRKPDPYAPLWKTLTARPRPSFEFDGIAWGAFPGLDVDENPTCEAAELAEAGDHEGARELLIETVGADLRCIDAHAHLGNLVFDRSPKRAMLHYEIGIRIGELSLPAGFEGLLVWGRIYNRPFLRCLHGYGLCLWRLGKLGDAQRVFERILSLNPNDNQGIRFCWEDVRHERSWEEMHEREETQRVDRQRVLR
jgi:tetratricopeptide (TPR) repeat protein